MASSPQKDSELWYLEIGGSRLGPYSPLAIRALHEKNEINEHVIVRPASANSPHAGTTFTVGEFLKLGIDFSPKATVPLNHVNVPNTAPAPPSLTPNPLQAATEPTRVLTNPGGAYELLNVIQTYRQQTGTTKEIRVPNKAAQTKIPVAAPVPEESGFSLGKTVFALAGVAAIGAVVWVGLELQNPTSTPDAETAKTTAPAATLAKHEEADKPASAPAPHRAALALKQSAPAAAAPVSRLQRLRERERVAAAAAADVSKDRDREDERERERDREREPAAEAEADRAGAEPATREMRETRDFRDREAGGRAGGTEENAERSPDSISESNGSQNGENRNEREAAPVQHDGVAQPPGSEIPIASP